MEFIIHLHSVSGGQHRSAQSGSGACLRSPLLNFTLPSALLLTNTTCCIASLDIALILPREIRSYVRLGLPFRPSRVCDCSKHLATCSSLSGHGSCRLRISSRAAPQPNHCQKQGAGRRSCRDQLVFTIGWVDFLSVNLVGSIFEYYVACLPM